MARRRPAHYDNTGRADALQRRRAHDPDQHPERHLPRMDPAHRQQPAHQGAVAGRGSAMPHNYPRSLQQLVSVRGHRSSTTNQLGSSATTSPGQRPVDGAATSMVEQVRKALGLDWTTSTSTGAPRGDRSMGTPSNTNRTSRADRLRHDGQHLLPPPTPRNVLMPQVDRRHWRKSPPRESKTDDPAMHALLMQRLPSILRMPLTEVARAGDVQHRARQQRHLHADAGAEQMGVSGSSALGCQQAAQGKSRCHLVIGARYDGSVRKVDGRAGAERGVSCTARRSHLCMYV